MRLLIHGNVATSAIVNDSPTIQVRSAEPAVQYSEQALGFRDIAVTRTLVLVFAARKLIEEADWPNMGPIPLIWNISQLDGLVSVRRGPAG